MNDEVRQALVGLLSREGRAVCDDPRRCVALLKDLCPGHKREVSVLADALNDGVVEGLSISDGAAPVELTIRRLAQRLVEDRGLGDWPAEWAVAAWAIALGLASDAPPPDPTETAARERPGERPLRQQQQQQRVVTADFERFIEVLSGPGLCQQQERAVAVADRPSGVSWLESNLGRPPRAEPAESAAWSAPPAALSGGLGQAHASQPAPLAGVQAARPVPSAELRERRLCPRCSRRLARDGRCRRCARVLGMLAELESKRRAGKLAAADLILLADLCAESGLPVPAGVAQAAGAYPNPALWNPAAVGAWSALFTPVFGSVLLGKNWAAIGDRRRVRSARRWLAASVAVYLTGPLFPFLGLFSLAWYMLCMVDQVSYVRARWGSEYSRRDWLVPLVLGCVMLMMSGLGAGYGLLRGFPGLTPCDFAVNLAFFVWVHFTVVVGAVTSRAYAHW
jgi:hypothetical protein